MSVPAKIALLFIVLIDLLGQGLLFPIINALIMEPTSSFLHCGHANRDGEAASGRVGEWASRPSF